jgi:hypothetical protein
MTAYRKKNRSDEVVASEQYQAGLTVWVGERPNRQQMFCSGYGDELITPEEHSRRKTERAENNRRNFYVPRSARRSGGHSMSLWG